MLEETPCWTEADLIKRLKEMGIKLLLIPRIRFYLCKIRWRILRKNLRFFEHPSAGVGSNVVTYNLTAFDHDSAFGAGARMDILLYPLAALFYPTPSPAKVLIVGPRTEDDIFLAKALGLPNTRGLDLFSYSPFIDIGDMHTLPYADAEFDAVVLGWVLAYSSDPTKAIEQSRRVLKKDGFLAIGWEWAPDPNVPSDIRGNHLNSVREIRELVDFPAVFIHDPKRDINHHKAMIFRK